MELAIMNSPIRFTSRSGPDDLAVAAQRYNAALPRVGIVVLKPFGWEGRVTEPGEKLSVTVGDSKDLIFRGKARKA